MIAVRRTRRPVARSRPPCCRWINNIHRCCLLINAWRSEMDMGAQGLANGPLPTVNQHRPVKYVKAPNATSANGWKAAEREETGSVFIFYSKQHERTSAFFSPNVHVDNMRQNYFFLSLMLAFFEHTILSIPMRIYKLSRFEFIWSAPIKDSKV